MQAQQAEGVARIAERYDEIEKDTGHRLNRFVQAPHPRMQSLDCTTQSLAHSMFQELRRRKTLMKESYRAQMQEAHAQLASYHEQTEQLQAKNGDLIVANCELLKTVDALEQVKVLQEEELERSSLALEEMVKSHATALGKSESEVKRITEAAIQDRVALRMKYGSKVQCNAVHCFHM